MMLESTYFTMRCSKEAFTEQFVGKSLVYCLTKKTLG